MKEYKENNDIEEFTGFIPKQLPDNIHKVVYSLVQEKPDNIIICVKYYTSFKSINSIKKKVEEEENSNNKENNINNGNSDKNKIIDNEEKENIFKSVNENINIKCGDSDSDYEDPSENKGDNNVFNVNKLKISEKLFLGRIFSIIRKKHKVILIDNLFDNKKKSKLSFVRFIETSSEDYKILFKVKINPINSLNLNKNNFYLPNLFMGSIKSKNYTDICSIYRINKLLDFIKEKHYTFKMNNEYQQQLINDSFYDDWSDSD